MIKHYQRIANLLKEAGATPEMNLDNRILSIFRDNGEEVSLSENQFFEETPRAIQLWQFDKGLLFLMHTFRKQHVCVASYEDSPGVAELLRPLSVAKA